MIRLRQAGLPVVLWVLAVGAGSCADATGPGVAPAEITGLPRSLTLAETQALEAVNEFGLDLLRRLHAARGPDEANVFVSPLSASMALAMALNGADGETFDSMSHALGLRNLTLEQANDGYRDLLDLFLTLDSSVEIRIANSAWLQPGYPIRSAYRDRVREVFGARVENVDFPDPAAALINQWVDEATRGRIRDFVSGQELATTIALLANAVYFKGSWTDRFDPAATASEPFLRPDESTVSVPMMYQALEAAFDVSDSLAIVDLPYGGRAFSMTVLVPAGGVTLEHLVQSITPERWRALLAGLQRRRGDVWLPRFALSYSKRLNDVLIEMGMGVAFDPARADFGRLVQGAASGAGPWIEWVKQKSFAMVDEDGTEAAAATAVSINVSANAVVRVDRPFLFAIRERFSGAILFVGTVTDPTAG